MRRGFLVLLACAATMIGAERTTLDFHFIDVEGGQATLIITPAGQSMLVDAGWPGFNGRDADRIVAAAKKAGLSQIDYVLVTHYHMDHIGGVPQLAQKFPVKAFIDHGENTESGGRADELALAYKALMQSGVKRITVGEGDSLPLKGVKTKVVAARGKTIGKPMSGAGRPNPLCKDSQTKQIDTSENARSVGFVLEWDDFTFVDLADLTWNKELDLACSEMKLPKADLFLSTHHGMDASNTKELVHALEPRVIVMNNGAKKGGSPAAWEIYSSAPGLKGLWQLHTAVVNGPGKNAEEKRISNVSEKCEGKEITVRASKDGSMVVTNERNGYSETYGAQK